MTLLSRRHRSMGLAAAVAVGLSACSGSSEDAATSSSAATWPASSSPATTPPATTGASTTSPARPATQTVATGLDVPWGLAFLPDGSALVTLRDTRQILQLRSGAAPRAVATVANARPDNEAGLLGIAVSPTFATDRRVFVYYTADNDNRIERMTWTGNALRPDRVILSGIPKGQVHDGGRIAFGPDRQLYVGTGDAGDRERSQNRSDLGGKILRITQDGAPSPGNPSAGSPVWSWGHRNVQGLAWDAAGRMYATEFGQNDFDELNLIKPGSNYGWPIVEGTARREGMVDPLVTWRPSDASPSGLAIGSDGAAYVAGLAGRTVWRVPLNDGAAGTPARVSALDLGRVRTVATAPDGRLWVVSSNTFRGSERDGDDRIVAWQP